MKTIHLLLVTIFIISGVCNSQDLVVKTSGEQIYVNVNEITPEEIVFNFIGKDSIIFTYPLSEIHKIEYKNGSVFVFNDLKSTQIDEPENNFTEIKNENTDYSDEEITNLAINDARQYYNPFGAQVGTACSTLSCGCIGLTYAAISSGITPSSYSLNIPEENSYTNNPLYRQQYSQEAKRIKSKKVWEIFSVCLLIDCGFLLLSYSSGYE